MAEVDQSVRAGAYKTCPLQDMDNSAIRDNAVGKASLKFNYKRPAGGRTASTPPTIHRKQSHTKYDKLERCRTTKAPPLALDLTGSQFRPINDRSANSLLVSTNGVGHAADKTPSPGLTTPSAHPLSIPAYLQLELNSTDSLFRSEFPFESSTVKLERLRDFLLLPAPLEHLMWFGTFACIDAWLHTFTILPLRFIKALIILLRWWVASACRSIHNLIGFVYVGLGRLWRRSRTRIAIDSLDGREPALSGSCASPSADTDTQTTSMAQDVRNAYRRARIRSTPSLLSASHKADLLKGLLVLITSFFMLQVDPSRMYHNIRGQAAIKLYVIYNGLEMGDRLLSALGQDVLECLFSREVLDRNADGRSRIIRPAWMFLIALFYNIIHTYFLLYQVITLNVAVNSYSNALLTLLLSNQFVEIKAAVFKKIEKDNLFQLTCADIVERFQLWLMLLVIAMRNMIEVGGITISISSSFEKIASSTRSATAFAASVPTTTNSASKITLASPAFQPSRILPASFTMIPQFTGQIIAPFIIVFGSEIMVDWIKHAYINKFNDTKPRLYGRFLDILAKDYYLHAFGDQNLMKRFGLPILPLACLFIRAAVQTYHMCLAAHMPLSVPLTATSLALNYTSSFNVPATSVALAHVDALFRRALGRARDANSLSSAPELLTYIKDDTIAFCLLLLICLVVFLLFLATKLVLGMVMLQWARSRYSGMKKRASQRMTVGGKRLGVSAMVEVDDAKRSYLYQDDPDGLARYQAKQDKIMRDKESEGKEATDLNRVRRYDMVAKRIW